MASDPREDAFDIARRVATLPAAERAAAIVQWCGDDAELRAAVEARLAARQGEASDGFATADVGPGTQPDSRASADALAFEREGQIIGRYKLLQQIGEGGFGTVWMAEQREPVKRRVALKIIKVGMDTKQVVARFEAERQALALMDHPNIAKVFDAGSTDAGRPYFVMEYIKGVPILEYCDTAKLDTNARLALFMNVCQAIQHAHQKGIIHRDIKPSNVLVTMHDGTPVPKVIDFGIAKATNVELTSRTLFTEHRQIIGTPAYMSPEQAELSGLDIDTRSDIYSLGVLLYELLTGTTPFPQQELMSGGFAEMMRIIREVEPHKPSTRISTLGDLGTSTATRRGALDVRELQSTLRGDLDWIVMKCLEKDRTRRYESASGLAADVLRHLKDEPVVAGPPGTAYRVGKFVKRNRGRVIAASVIAAALVLGVIGTSVGMVIAYGQKARADAEARRVEAINAFVTKALQASDPFASGARDVTVTEAMSNAIRDLDTGAFRDDPLTDAALRDTIGVILVNNGALREAKPLLEAAVAARERLLQPDDPAIATSLVNLATLFYGQGDYARAEALLQQARAIQSRSLAPDDPAAANTLLSVGVLAQAQGRYPEAESALQQALALFEASSDDREVEVAGALNSLALLRITQQRFADAGSLYERALGIYERRLSPTHPYLAHTLNSLGEVALHEGRVTEAESLYGRALKLIETSLGAEHPNMPRCLHNLATVYQRQGRLEEAEALQRRAIAISERVLGAQHIDVATGLNNLANTLLEDDRYPEAEPMLVRALGITEGALGPDHPSVALSLLNLAQLRLDLGRREEAEPQFVRAVSIFERALGPTHSNTLAAKDGLSTLHWANGDTDQAIELSTEVKRGYEETLGATHPTTLLAKGDLGVICMSAGKYEESIPLLREAYRAANGNPELVEFGPHLLGALAQVADPNDDGRDAEIGTLAQELAAGARASLPAGSSERAAALALLGHPLLKARRPVEAEAVLREALAIREALEPDKWTTCNVKSMLGGALLGQGKFAEAEPLLLEGYRCLVEREASIPPSAMARVNDAIERIAALYEAKGQPDEAAAWRAKRRDLSVRGRDARDSG
ncbi:MAG: tetratricopeptide repeat protein [Phycisphaerae bacterium]|nr:tetratricopeptide repeat protein [Phycisphaerae bacterium]